MKNFKVLALILFMLFVSKPVVNAACSVEENSKLYKEASNVKVSYEVLQRDASNDPGFNFPDGMTDEQIENFTWMEDYFRIYISNLTTNLYVEVKNNVTDEVKTYSYSDSNNGIVSFDQMDKEQIYNYTVTVYSSINTNCEGTKLYTAYTSTPMFNYVSDEPACEGVEEFYACKKWLSVPITNMETLYDRIEKYKEGLIDKDGEEKEEPSKEEEKGFKKFVKENKAIIIATTVCIVAVGGLVTVIIVKKQRSKRI